MEVKIHDIFWKALLSINEHVRHCEEVRDEIILDQGLI